MKKLSISLNEINCKYKSTYKSQAIKIKVYIQHFIS